MGVSLDHPEPFVNGRDSLRMDARGDALDHREGTREHLETLGEIEALGIEEHASRRSTREHDDRVLVRVSFK